MPGLPLSQAIEVALAWIELDRHASTGTVATCGFSDFVGGDAGIPNIAELDRDILRGYQRHLPRARTGPKGAWRPLAISTRSRRLVALRSWSTSRPVDRLVGIRRSGAGLGHRM
jgi:hypothetical protein